MIVAVMEDFEAYGQLREPPAVEATPRPQPAVRPTTRRSHWLRNALLVAALVFGYGLLAVATAVQPLSVPFTSTRLTVPFPGGAPALFGLPNRPFVVLVIGLDRRPTETGPSRTDTILLARIDPKKHTSAFLSIPRDSLMEVPSPDGGYSQDRINTAFVYNWSSKDSSAAPEALASTIEHNLGIKVDHYVVFDQRSAEQLIDALGGVSVDNPKAFGQTDYSDDDVHVVPQSFAEGKIDLNGYEAVAYGRIREGSTDFDRIERQQRVASALVHKAASFSSIFHLPSVWSAYGDTVKTDMSKRQAAGVFSMLKGVSDDKLKTKSLADAEVACNSCNAAVLYLDPAKTQQIIAEAFGDQAAGARAAQLLVAAGVTP